MKLISRQINSNYLFPLFFVFSIVGCIQTKKSSDNKITHYENYDNKLEVLSDNKLKENFEYCSKGTKQSPVDIIRNKTKKEKSLPKLVPSYTKYPLRIWNNQHTIKVKFDKSEQLTIGKDKFELLQFHFHTPSEHTIDGKLAEMEIHFVHQNENGDFAVIAILMRTGKENAALKDLFENLPKEDHTDITVLNSIINPSDILPKNLEYYSYFGSLTTPPCVEKVHWYVLKNEIEISPAQLQNFKSVFVQNARPVFPLNDRVIETSISE